jgi:Protein of unknown function (DUF2393)
MSENKEVKPDSERRSPTVLLIGAVGMILIIALFYWASRYAPAPIKPLQIPLSMGPAEQEYVSHIEFEPQAQQVARATNFLNQEATFVFGTVKNNGSRSVRQIEVTLEFHDVFKQVVLRDKERLWSPDAIPLAPGHMRDFQITYEAMPAQWDQAYPTLRITGLNLQ